MGTGPGLKAFVAAVIGELELFLGLFWRFFLGIIETLVSAFGGSLYKDAGSIFSLIIVLLKPNELLGKKITEKV